VDGGRRNARNSRPLVPLTIVPIGPRYRRRTHVIVRCSSAMSFMRRFRPEAIYDSRFSMPSSLRSPVLRSASFVAPISLHNRHRAQRHGEMIRRRARLSIWSWGPASYLAEDRTCEGRELRLLSINW
jgi:hypothetical protein